MSIAQSIISEKAYSLLEALFVLLFVGLFFGIFISTYSSTVQLNIDLQIRQEIENKIQQVDNVINSQEDLKIFATSENTLNQSIVTGAIFELENNILIPSNNSNFITSEECEKTFSNNNLTQPDLFFPACYQIFIKKVSGGTNLYCYYIYSIAKYSNGKIASLSKNGLVSKSLILIPNSSIIYTSIDNNNNDNYCATY